jgi:stage II sporulation protein AA (anti-sigma F factor antagonist)
MANFGNDKSYTLRQEGNTCVIDVTIDSFDHRYIEEFKSAINHCLLNHNYLLLNLAHVTFMDSAGLGIILFGHRSCKQAGGEFCVSNVSGYVTKLFGLTGVSKAVKVYNTEEDCLTYLQSLTTCAE